MRDEYDFTAEDFRKAERGKYAARYAEGVNIVKIDADLAKIFPDSAAVNQALRALASVIESHRQNAA